jgi:hypothetical protein
MSSRDAVLDGFHHIKGWSWAITCFLNMGFSSNINVIVEV